MEISPCHMQSVPARGTQMMQGGCGSDVFHALIPTVSRSFPAHPIQPLQPESVPGNAPAGFWKVRENERFGMLILSGKLPRQALLGSLLLGSTLGCSHGFYGYEEG